MTDIPAVGHYKLRMHQQIYKRTKTTRNIYQKRIQTHWYTDIKTVLPGYLVLTLYVIPKMYILSYIYHGFLTLQIFKYTKQCNMKHDIKFPITKS